jgi:hypothetical protein
MSQKATPAIPPVQPDRRHRRRIATLLNPGILLATTAVLAALEPKTPPYKGD